MRIISKGLRRCERLGDDLTVAGTGGRSRMFIKAQPLALKGAKLGRPAEISLAVITRIPVAPRSSRSVHHWSAVRARSFCNDTWRPIPSEK